MRKLCAALAISVTASAESMPRSPAERAEYLDLLAKAVAITFRR